MAKQKKEVEHFKVSDGKVFMYENDIEYLSDTEKKKLALYVKELGYDLIFIEPEPKKKNYFTVEKAEKYLKKKKKEDLITFRSFKKDADKLAKEYSELKKAQKKGGEGAPDDETVQNARKAMIIAQKDAFLAQKEWFKDTYGIDEYDIVRTEY